MFRIAQSPSFWLDVEFDYTAEDGARKKGRFDVRAKRLSVDEMQSLQDRVRTEQLEDRAVVREIVLGWRGVTDENDQAVEYTAEALEQLMNLGVAGAIVMSFFASYPKARQKN